MTKISKKIIKDLVHEYIEIDDRIKAIIDTKEFQRLKKVKQLTALYIYPSANHTRFEHSLGVMKLAMDFFSSIKDDLEKELIKEHLIEDDLLKKELVKEKLDYYQTNLQIAALLHDLGHAPLSHLGEQFYDREEIISEIICFDNKVENIFENEIEKNSIASHELMSCYCISNLNDLLTQKFDKKFDYEFICRIITGKLYKEKTEGENWEIKNIIIEIVNSDSIDVDKLDYLQRDNHMCGYPTAKLDLYRFFKSVCLYKPKDEELSICFKQSGVPVLQNIIDSRDILYMWVYNHHLAVYTDTIISEILKKNKEDEEVKRIFSCDGIVKDLASDEDILMFLKKRYLQLKKKKDKDKKLNDSENKEIVLLSQLFTRNLLKPLWKTFYEYNNLLDKNEIKFLEDTKDLKNFKKKLKEKIKKEQLLNKIEVAERANKFYFKNKKPKFYIKTGTNLTLLSDLLPQRDFKEVSKVAFYIFSENIEKKETKIKEIKRAIKEIIKEESNNITN